MGKKAALAGLIGLTTGVAAGELITNYITGTFHEANIRTIYAMRGFFDLTIGIGLASGLYKGVREREKEQESKIEVDRAFGVPPYTGQLKGGSGEKTSSNSYETRDAKVQPNLESVTMEEAIDMFKRKEQEIESKVQAYVSRHPEISHEPRQVQGAYFARDVLGEKVDINAVRKAALRRKKPEEKLPKIWTGED